ncbi:MAG: peptide deformylase [Nitrospiraceae bacterium]|nr:MAG: peptide deformylase [bacterium]UCF87173.1 MAG: peptide deformylase [Nitrospiraceae bacterium]
MAIREIRRYPEKVLQEKTSPVSDFTTELRRLIDDMVETMYAAPGIGLAANQVGIPKQVIVIDVSGRGESSDLITLVNPRIIEASGESEIEEGCLSVPGYTTVVKRAEKVKVAGFDLDGKPVEISGEGILAKALQHEIDHINGVLFIDKIGRIKREFFKKRYARQQK